MPYHHFAHLDSFSPFLKKGVLVKRGDRLGTVGKSGTQWAHLHYEVRKAQPDTWTQYVYTDKGSMTKEQVQSFYENPEKWIDKAAKIPASFTTYGGYMWLDPINSSKTAFHPGVDINDGYGNDDLGNPVKVPCDGEVVYVGKKENGWGNHVWIYEDDSKVYPQVDLTFAQANKGRIFLQVEKGGELWYVNPDTGHREYMGGCAQDVWEFLRHHAIGISNEDLNKIPNSLS